MFSGVSVTPHVECGGTTENQVKSDDGHTTVNVWI